MLLNSQYSLALLVLVSTVVAGNGESLNATCGENSATPCPDEALRSAPRNLTSEEVLKEDPATEDRVGLGEKDMTKAEKEFKARLLLLLTASDPVDEINDALDILGPPPMPISCTAPTADMLLSGSCCPFEPYLRTFLCQLIR